MALLRHLSYELILSLTTTWVRLLQCDIGEHCGLCLALLGGIDRDRLLRDLTRVAIDEALETSDEEPEECNALGSLPATLPCVHRSGSPPSNCAGGWPSPAGSWPGS
jgi:hypothetical protein